MKKYALIICALICSMTAMAQTDSSIVETDHVNQNPNTPQNVIIRFGYLNYTDVIKTMPEYKQAMAEMDTIKATYDKEVTISEAELNKRFTEYIEGQKTFPENILLKRQKEIQLLIEQGVKFKEEAKKLLTKAEKEIMAPVYKRLDDVLLKVGTKHNLAFILNTDNNSCPFINPKLGTDITEIVISELEGE